MKTQAALVLIKNPAGTYHFVGSVPFSLSYTMIDGSPVDSDLQKNIAAFGPGLFNNRIKAVTFKTVPEAIAAAKKIGATITQISE